MGGGVRDPRRIGSRRDMGGGRGVREQQEGYEWGGGGERTQKDRLQEGYEWWEFQKCWKSELACNILQLKKV